MTAPGSSARSCGLRCTMSHQWKREVRTVKLIFWRFAILATLPAPARARLLAHSVGAGKIGSWALSAPLLAILFLAARTRSGHCATTESLDAGVR